LYLICEANLFRDPKSTLCDPNGVAILSWENPALA